MEVNATPSMKVAHEEAATQQLIQQQKWDFVQDTFQLLRIQQHMFEEVRAQAGERPGANAGNVLQKVVKHLLMSSACDCQALLPLNCCRQRQQVCQHVKLILLQGCTFNDDAILL